MSAMSALSFLILQIELWFCETDTCGNFQKKSIIYPPKDFSICARVCKDQIILIINIYFKFIF